MSTESFQIKYYRLRRFTLLLVVLIFAAAAAVVVQPEFINDLSQRVIKRLFIPAGTYESYPVHIEYEFVKP